LALAAVTASGLVGGYGEYIVAAVAFTSISVLAVGMLAGLSGIWSLGHMAFVALGAYLAANLSAAGVPVEAIVPVAVVAASAVGFVLGLSAGRFSILYFGLLTMALSLAATEVIGHWDSVTGGDEGMQVPPARIALLGRDLDLHGAAVLAVLLATLAFLAASLAQGGGAGRRWRAVKTQRIAATAIGLKPHVENASAFALSAGIASLSGVAVAFVVGYLDPVSFDLNAGVRLIVAAVVGGTGSLAGALLGAAFIVGVPELARGAAAVAAFVFGVAVVLTLLFLRQGIAPALLQAGRGIVPRASAPPDAAEALNEEALLALIRQLLPPATEALEVRDLSVRFGGVKALDQVGMTIPPGSTVGLIGPNGAGKTTFLNVLSGFYEAAPGSTVRFGQQDLLALKPYGRLAVGIGRTFQHAELFSELTLWETVELTARMGAARRARAGLPSLAPGSVATRILAGLNLARHAHSRPGTLPFGVQKVADFARMLASGTSMIALDEPFAGLDGTERAALHTILVAMRRAGVSILIIDHAVQEVMDVSDRVVAFEFGRLLAEGLPNEVRRHPEVMRAYFGSADEFAVPAATAGAP
jgi:branched-chain amino acid transport system permease protein